MINDIYMGRRPAGHRYPHATTAAKDADHSRCPVLAAVAQLVAEGREPWGTVHEHTVATEAEAIEWKNALYKARNHTGRKRGACYPRALSVRATIAPAGKKWRVTLQVWDRQAGKAEIVRRVQAGEKLAYNVRRED